MEFDESVERARDLFADVVYTYQSWRELVIDDANKIGLWCLDVEGISRPTRSPLSVRGGHEGRILRTAVDALSGGLSAVVEAYGDGDLREAHSSVLVLDDGTKILAYKMDRGQVQYGQPQEGRPPYGLQAKYIVRSARHHICRMNFPRRRNNGEELVLWDSGNTLSFQYGALEPQESQDYQICEFLRKDPSRTWEAAFRGPGPLPHGASRRRFVPRPLAFLRAERTTRAGWIRGGA